MKVKDTLNLGKTKFPMRGNLPIKELERENVWFENKVYEQRLKLNEGKPSFILHDGPPYANGNIHIGHALNKITKDMIVRFKSMSGFYAPYVPGWDTHGLPIEQQLTKAGHDRKKLSKVEWRKLAENFAKKQVDKQRADFKRLGVSAEWDNPYLTLNPDFEAAQVRTFGEMAKKGYIYKGKKPVYWSWSSESALAEAEIEYHDVVSPTAFYGEQVIDGLGILDNDTYMVVWTTTPWTIPGSRGITIGENFEYSVVKPVGSDKKYVIATDLLTKDAEKFGWVDYTVEKTVRGVELENILVQHPFYNDIKLVTMLGDFVTLDAGTGLVHTAPGFGEDDFWVGQKYNLEVAVPVNDQGLMTKEAGSDFEGVFYEDANAISLKKLADLGLLLKQEDIEHSYPFDWRTKKPIIFRAVPQWFASVEAFRQQILDALDEVTFLPEWGKVRLYNMIRDRGDWVISRQRVWGVPLPIFYAEDKTPILNEETINHVAELFEKYGSNVWFEREAKDLLPEGYTSEHSPNGEFTKEEDIMDVWFDSGSSHQGVLATRNYLSNQADLYLEGSDQYRGWFNSSLITSVAVTGRAPYKSILSQGFVLDGQGRKMSKSEGNSIVPNDVIKQMGAEIIRLWVASVDTDSDVRVSMEILKQSSETYRKIRNTMRFLLANTSDYNAKTDAIAFNDMPQSDQYFYVLVNELTRDILDMYDKYDFVDLFKRIVNFINVDLSAYYLDYAKDVVYVEAPDSLERRSMQTVFYKTVLNLTKLLLPILPHTSEEIWEYLQEGEAFAYLSEMPQVEELANSKVLVAKWHEFRSMRDSINKALEEARDDKLIGKPAEAAVTLYLTEAQTELVASLNVDIRVMLLVSQLHLANRDDAPTEALEIDGLQLVVKHAEGEVSQRDRLYHTDLGADSTFPTLSKHEAAIVRKYYPEAVTAGFED
ncbi:isoleucine--tRNA ligase [Periweissella beninensis]|uniref:Isoleucine--tRNA ligase n=1 Tax=Periweissella beninensis TaxID=504936 RepID=A0ABT0VIU1_9LACO|nr:isoleucine--tRNA ligase [Periweissella beninensis]MBM7544211.1 isoleucyl-tRNA synthetase [Periweissella beninensis]MCM2437581.1 isoleucine--tRNA ligase [Periweissella beninensis]MCT4396616.1 isoleucine--tRNA ligase [Periweissella beninensis]